MALAVNRARVEVDRGTGGYTDPAEAGFYARYVWCLNPLLSLDDQLSRLAEELEYASSLPSGWQRDEGTINVYLLACGIACTVDDYLGQRVGDLVAIAERFPQLRWVIPATRRLLSITDAVWRPISHPPVRYWRERWARCVEIACAALVGTTTPDGERWRELRSTCDELRRMKLPRGLLRRRLRIPEGYRCQDLAHHDVLTLAQRFADRHVTGRGALAVIGVRTAGAYFAPLASAYLSARGWSPVSWHTVRPRQGVTRLEEGQLRKLAKDQAQLVLIDDHPDTGRTLALLLTAVQRAGVAPERITILVPRHPVRPDWRLPCEAPGADRVAVITLEPQETYKAQLMTPAGVAPLLREWLGRQGWQRIAVRTSPAIDAVNTRLAAHCRDEYQVRLQHLFEVQLERDDGEAVVVHIVAKSVGWGWLGYHAYLAGAHLTDFVPRLIGQRHGLLFSQWVGELTDPPTGSARIAPATLAAYVARRTRSLQLEDAPGLESHDCGWNGWKVLAGMLRRAYGPYFGRLKIPALRTALRGFECPQPMLIDGRMRPSEWLETPVARYKVDYEHHNFGPAEPNLADPAYDLATAVFEFQLSEPAEAELVHAYAREVGDASVAERVVLHKLLRGTLVMQQASYWAPRAGSERQRAHWNERYLAARDFLAYELHGLCAGLLPRPPRASWSGPLFFLDLDGVFDSEVFGFPHTTPSGLAALTLLTAQGFAVALNTGRSAEHVRRYCSLYGLAGGVAEYGSVFVDAVGGRELVFTTPKAREQLERCRGALRALPGVFVDPHYRYAVRAFRYQGGSTVGLHVAELDELLSRAEFRGLASIATSADSYIVQHPLTKGTALAAVKHALGRAEVPVVAIGDSDQDLPMLEAAETWYAPANCSPRIRALARSRGGQIMTQPKQRGFLQAVHDLLRRRGVRAEDTPIAPRPPRVRTAADLLVTFLHIAERPRLAQFLAACAWRRL